MKWILVVAACGVLGAFAMPHHEPGHAYGLNDQENQNEPGPTERSLLKEFIIPEELYNSEASPALPPFLPSRKRAEGTGGIKTGKIISVTIPITTIASLESNYVPDTTTTFPTTTTTIPTTTATTSTTTTTSPPKLEDFGGITTAASSPSSFILPIRGANPSIQLLPPDAYPTSPTTISPRNFHEIPLSLVSLSGNSGAITSSEEDISPSQENPEQMGVDFTKYRYHVETGQLVKIGSTGRGVCPQNMRFFAVPGHPKNGACDCDYYQCSRPLIYSPEKHQCFWSWSQGPCEEGEWFVFNNDLRRRGSCVKNPCPPELIKNNTSDSSHSPSSSDYFFLNPEDETCYEAGTQGSCTDSDERLLIFPGEPIPKCRKFTLCYPLTVPQELQCIFGNKYFVESGHC